MKHSASDLINANGNHLSRRWPFPTYWKREYFAEVCDGIQWEVKIITDDFVFKSHGSNAFPSDFEDFLKIVREFTGVGEFADSFDRKMSRV